MPFWAYLLHCHAGRFSAGHTDDLERRIAQHKAGLLPGFTRDYLPVELVWSQDFPTRDEAKAAETRIKGWSRRKKLALIRGDWAEISRLAKSKSSPSTSSGQTEMGVHSSVIEQIRSEAARAHPHECCGILLGTAQRIEAALPTRNVHPAPRTQFEIDPQALIDAHRAARGGGPQVAGYYHSHPAGPPEPSATDRAAAAHDGRVWAIIGADGTVRLWRDAQSGFTRLSYAAVGD